MKPIKSISELKELAAREDGCDCFILLNFGAKSSKFLRYYDDSDKWYVYNEIDGSEIICKTDELGDYTNIPEALEKKALILS